MEKRITAIEEILASHGVTVQGTTISRVLATEHGIEWCLGFGMMNMPKWFFNGPTINTALLKAEKWAAILDAGDE